MSKPIFYENKVAFNQRQALTPEANAISTAINKFHCNTIQSSIAAAERVFQVFDLKEMTAEGSRKISVEECVGTVDIEHVAFSYTREKPLITDLSLHVNAGDSIAIVGPTGPTPDGRRADN